MMKNEVFSLFVIVNMFKTCNFHIKSVFTKFFFFQFIKSTSSNSLSYFSFLTSLKFYTHIGHISPLSINLNTFKQTFVFFLKHLFKIHTFAHCGSTLSVIFDKGSLDSRLSALLLIIAIRFQELLWMEGMKLLLRCNTTKSIITKAKLSKIIV